MNWRHQSGVGCRSAPRAAEERIERVADADIFISERTDRATKNLAPNIGDLARVKNDFPPVNYEVRPDIAVWKAKLLRGEERDDNPLD
ncbi:MAG: hypothetical protein QOG25_3640 [Acetobacteraceae bacterium]|nr:hypothetical protein [Acetobacteraceae bacterium]